jgi:DNA-binding response OmpR family regulator
MSLRPEKILIADDEPDILEILKYNLVKEGYDVTTAKDGDEAIAKANTIQPDLVILDIMMPELDGYGVLHMLRKNPSTENTPFIFLTAKTERSDFRKGMEMGADDYITKPFEDIELLNAVETRLKRLEILDQKYAGSSQGLIQFIQDVNSTGLVEKLSEQYETENYNKKQMLYIQGRRPRFLYYLSKGKVKSFKSHEDGKEYITNL